MPTEELQRPHIIDIPEEQQGAVYVAIGYPTATKRFYIESYGCAMNFSDSEIVASILGSEGYSATSDIYEANLVLVNTCSIREKAEDTVRKRLEYFNSIKRTNKGMIVGVLGCMAERLKKSLLEQEKLVDMVVGPDAYRDLPKLISNLSSGDKQINVLLSREETYADISPVRLESNGVTAYISIMRGCDNMCSFCVVPYTRGRERSRDAHTIVKEAQDLFNKGYKEVTLLGQNVDSYKWLDTSKNSVVTFANLLAMVAEVDPLLRVRFSTSHPKDIDDEVLYTIAKYHNICKYIHLPVQSGSSRILELMNRSYDADWYRSKIDRIYEIIPECSISSDIITGFCSETEEDHQESLAMIDYAGYILSYMFSYSERPGTPAARKLTDDISLEVKNRRLSEVIERQRILSGQLNKKDEGKNFEVLIEGLSKKSDKQMRGKTSHNKVVIFDVHPEYKIGDYANVYITSSTTATLFGTIIQ
ncbi:MAG: tRNA (N6-isopentenyl adenosine(37)-C2)-methylthiotransferase MiaB [Saprospiraceae bacterium]|nr:tRNA (N6-isopentenyl adenosine(37)-C2)-methylthiotransferase MiaB [Candidatus Brachybacter algidus]MBK8749348.1 tRNA (N6-isopentenyl adenosine(37)-C2)-methylthiotransferase MiaB [Candidatus Brachybacter algidus]